MKRGNLPIALYLLLVFISGAVVGALGYRAYKPPVASSNAPSPEEVRRQYLHEMETRAKLSPEQIQRLTAIMDETRARFHASREQHNLEVKQIGDQQRAKIRTILTADQLPKVEQLWKERDQRAKQQNAR